MRAITYQSNLRNPGAMLLAALMLLVILGCGGGSTTTANTTFPVTTTITSTGGTVTNGPATLTVPGGAVTLPTTIQVQTATSYTADSRIVKNTVFSFDANGATFTQPVTIGITYTTANMPANAVESSLTLFKLVSNVWTQVTNSSVDTTNKIVTGSDTTLGIYAVLATTFTTTGATTTGSTVTVLITSDRAAAYTTPNLYTLKADGTGLTELTNLLQGQSVSSGFFKPDGTMIVFTEQLSGGSNLNIMTASGTGVTTLVGNDFRPDGTRTHNHDGEFSADGTKIVFASDRTGEDEVYIMNPDGSGVTALTQNFPNGNQMGPVSFTRSGQITFTDTSNGVTSYYLVNTNGTGFTQVSFGALSLFPWWSYNPYGTSIVYVKATGSVYDVYVTNATGTSSTKITSLGATSIRRARFSYDGTKILFDASINGGNPDVYSVNPDGTGLLNITNNPANDRFMDAH